MVSYGHDIDAAWLIEEAAAIIKNQSLWQHVKQHCVNLVISAKDGLETVAVCGMNTIFQTTIWLKKHRWTLAETMVGFFNAWQITGGEKFLQRSLSIWDFIQQHIRDQKNGEWFWGIKFPFNFYL